MAFMHIYIYIYISCYEYVLSLKTAFYGRNMLLIFNYKQSCVQTLFIVIYLLVYCRQFRLWPTICNYALSRPVYNYH